jgi:16S rRNA (adenine1518-N6/adenine1519-N6)-dimethyltransferase
MTRLDGHQARKQFGQNFLVDQRVIEDILSIIDARPSDTIVEIGPGLGALTAGLVRSGASVHAIEIDRTLIPRLQGKFAQDTNFSLLAQDALTVDFAALRGSAKSLRVVGNLPYNISTPLLFHLLDALDVITDITVMLQLEVAERLAAAPACGDFGRLSVACQACCKVDLVLAVPPWSFEPKPKVDSAVVRLTPVATLPPASLRASLARITQRAFSLRRKVLRHSLGKMFSDTELASCGISDRQRPEEVSVSQYVALAELSLARPDER